MDIPKTQFEGHSSAVYTLAFNPDGAWLVSADYHGMIRLWNVRTGKLQSILRKELGYDYSVWALAFSPDGTILASGGGSGLRIYDTTTWAERFAHELGEIACIAWHPKEKVLACGTEVVTFCNGQTGNPFRTFKGHTDWVTAIAWNPTGTLLATGSESEDGSIRIWDFESGKQVAILEEAHSQLAGIAFPSDDKLFFTKGYGTLFEWEIRTGKTLKLFNSDNQGYLTGFSYDGRVIVYDLEEVDTAGQINHIAVRMADVSADRKPIDLTGHSDEITCIEFNSNNSILATADASGIIRVWNLIQWLEDSTDV